MRIYTARAAEILYRRFLEFKTKSPHAICSALGIAFIEDETLPPDSGFFTWEISHNTRRHTYRISVPQQDPRLRQDFICYHELAHFFLWSERIPIPHGSEEYWMVEAWCNNFALAMMLIRSGIDSTMRVSITGFFATGSELTDGDAVDRAIAERIDSYTRGHDMTPELKEFRALFPSFPDTEKKPLI